jgi:polyhydroxybutyrate depolymerase
MVGDRVFMVDIGGTQRSYVLHVPAAAATQKLPLVLALHGNGDQAQNFIQTSFLTQRTDAIVAAPQGIQRNISVGGSTAPNVAWDAYNTKATGNIDLTFLDKVRQDLVASGSVDTAKVSVFGYSQGGYLSYRYALHAADALSCAAVVAAADPSGVPGAFARKIPFVLQIGSMDYAIAQARATKTKLEGLGHELQYNEIQGAGHSPFPGDKKTPVNFCLSKSL